MWRGPPRHGRRAAPEVAEGTAVAPTWPGRTAAARGGWELPLGCGWDCAGSLSGHDHPASPRNPRPVAPIAPPRNPGTRARPGPSRPCRPLGAQPPNRCVRPAAAGPHRGAGVRRGRRDRCHRDGQAPLPGGSGRDQADLALHQQPWRFGHFRHGHLRHHAVRAARRGHHLPGAGGVDGAVPAVRRGARQALRPAPRPDHDAPALRRRSGPGHRHRHPGRADGLHQAPAAGAHRPPHRPDGGAGRGRLRP